MVVVVVIIMIVIIIITIIAIIMMMTMKFCRLATGGGTGTSPSSFPSSLFSLVRLGWDFFGVCGGESGGGGLSTFLGFG